MTDIGNRLIEERRRRRPAGDLRRSPQSRATRLRLVTGDRAAEFAKERAAASDADPLLSGHGNDDG